MAGLDGRWVGVWRDELSEGSHDAAVRARRIDFPGQVTPPGICPPGTLCLDAGSSPRRFHVTVEWEDFSNRHGLGVPVVRGDGWGTFWFFAPDNVELAVKVLDGRAVNGRFWVFAAGLSSVRYGLSVKDTVTGRQVFWENPSGTLMSRADTTTLLDFDGSVSAAATAAVLFPRRLVPSLCPCSSRSASRPVGPVSCAWGGDRFRVEATWTDFAGLRGAATGNQLTTDTAWPWFFDPTNPELLVKVLDGRALNGRYWVFFASMSNVGFELSVTDRMTDRTVTYVNPVGSFASRGDTGALH